MIPAASLLSRNGKIRMLLISTVPCPTSKTSLTTFGRFWSRSLKSRCIARFFRNERNAKRHGNFYEPNGALMKVEDIDTPALLVDLDAMEFNLQKLAGFFAGRRCKARPH